MRITDYLFVKDPKNANREELKAKLKKTPDYKDLRGADEKIDKLLDRYGVPKRIPKDTGNDIERKQSTKGSGSGNSKSKKRDS